MSDRYICTGSAGFLAELERGRRAGRPHDHVAFRERRREILRDQPPQLLRVDVVGVVVAVREHVGADQDAALHFGAEAFGAGLLVHVVEIAILRRAVAVAHAVEAREVARRFGRREHVVHRHRKLHVRKRHFDRLRSPALCTRRSRRRPLSPRPAQGLRRKTRSAARCAAPRWSSRDRARNLRPGARGWSNRARRTPPWR